jgi:hypothetical protein
MPPRVGAIVKASASMILQYIRLFHAAINSLCSFLWAIQNHSLLPSLLLLRPLPDARLEVDSRCSIQSPSGLKGDPFPRLLSRSSWA